MIIIWTYPVYRLYMSTHQPETSGDEVDVRAPLVQQRDELTHPCTPTR